MGKKEEQLGMSQSQANRALSKALLFQLIQECERDTCYRCGQRIESVDELSKDHKVPWLDSDDPVGLYFDLGNVAFSHRSCNYGEAWRGKKSPLPRSHYEALGRGTQAKKAENQEKFSRHQSAAGAHANHIRYSVTSKDCVYCQGP